MQCFPLPPPKKKINKVPSEVVVLLFLPYTPKKKHLLRYVGSAIDSRRTGGILCRRFSPLCHTCPSRHPISPFQHRVEPNPPPPPQFSCTAHARPRDFYHTCYTLSGLSVAQHCLSDNSPVVVGDSSNLLVRETIRDGN